jgi:hypothetical protein
MLTMWDRSPVTVRNTVLFASATAAQFVREGP